MCNFFGEYQESDKDLQTACKLPATNETSKSILSSLRSLQADYQRCDKKEILLSLPSLPLLLFKKEHV